MWFFALCEAGVRFGSLHRLAQLCSGSIWVKKLGLPWGIPKLAVDGLLMFISWGNPSIFLNRHDSHELSPLGKAPDAVKNHRIGMITVTMQWS